MKVVSLVPSVTETLLAWGVTPVAVTRFCEQPSLPAVGGTKDPDVDAVVAMQPDLVVMCDEENRREDAAALGAAGLKLHTVSVRTVDDVEAQLAALAAAVDVTPLAGLSGTVAVQAEAVPAKRRAFVPIWRRPWMTINGDTYGASLLARLGIETVFADEPDRYPTITLAEVAVANPDVVLAPSEPYPFRERHRTELEQVAPVVFVDGQDLFWWGVRTPAALARMVEAVRVSR